MNREDALQVDRPPGTSPGWTVWHAPSGKQAIMAVRYKTDAEAARTELLSMDIDWTQPKPKRLRLAYRVYVEYGRLRQQQIANNRYWPRPKGKG